MAGSISNLRVKRALWIPFSRGGVSGILDTMSFWARRVRNPRPGKIANIPSPRIGIDKSRFLALQPHAFWRGVGELGNCVTMYRNTGNTALSYKNTPAKCNNADINVYVYIRILALCICVTFHRGSPPWPCPYHALPFWPHSSLILDPDFDILLPHFTTIYHNFTTFTTFYHKFTTCTTFSALTRASMPRNLPHFYHSYHNFTIILQHLPQFYHNLQHFYYIDPTSPSCLALTQAGVAYQEMYNIWPHLPPFTTCTTNFTTFRQLLAPAVL